MVGHKHYCCLYSYSNICFSYYDTVVCDIISLVSLMVTTDCCCILQAMLTGIRKSLLTYWKAYTCRLTLRYNIICMYTCTKYIHMVMFSATVYCIVNFLCFIMYLCIMYVDDITIGKWWFDWIWLIW